MVPTVQPHLITRRKKQNDKYPVKLRVIYQLNYRDFPIGLDLSEDEFKNCIASSVKKPFRKTAIKSTEAVVKANKIIEEIGIFTFQKFEDQLYGRIKDSDIILLKNISNFYIRKKESKQVIAYKTARILLNISKIK